MVCGLLRSLRMRIHYVLIAVQEAEYGQQTRCYNCRELGQCRRDALQSGAIVQPFGGKEIPLQYPSPIDSN